jgi:hypothetical protein
VSHLNRIILLLALTILTISLSACSLQQPRPLPIEMMAYNSLTDEERELIPVSPKDSTVEKVEVTADIKVLVDSSYTKDQLYSVTFNRTATDPARNLVVYIALDEQTVVGKSLSGK